MRRSGIEDEQAQRDEFLLDAGREKQGVQLVGGLGRGVLGEDAVPGVAGELGHHERGRDAFAGDVADGDRQLVAREGHEVVVIAADLVGRVVMGEELEARDHRHGLGQEPLLHLLGKLQVAGQALALEQRLVHLGVLDRDRGLAGDGGQHVQVFLGELLAVAGIELNDAQCFLVGGDQGNAHDRADLEIGDRGARRQVLVGAGVLAQDGLLLEQDVVDDRPADAHGHFIGRDARGKQRLLARAVLERLADEPLGRGVDQDQEEALGLGKSSMSESRILGATASILSSLERFRVISRIALSLTSGLIMLAMALEREASRT